MRSISTQSNLSQLKVALVYDRVNTTHGGAERVLLALHQLFPQAPLLTALADNRAYQWSHNFTVQTSWLRYLPWASRWHRFLAALMPLAFEGLDLASYDLIISVTSAEAKGVLTKPHQLHVCYLLSPPRYLYHQRQEMLAAAWWQRIPVLSFIGIQAMRYLTWWDGIAASRPDLVIPISHQVAARFQAIYHRECASVIYPPIPITSVKPRLPLIIQNFLATSPQFWLMVARSVPYKRVDLAIAAAKKLNHPLVIVGSGPEFSRLRALCPTQVVMVPQVSEAELAWLYHHCQLVLVPGIEDFGLTALEANAAGKPVVVNQKAGVAELIKSGKHGIHMPATTVAALVTAITTCQRTHFSPAQLRQNAQKYGTSNFVREFSRQLITTWTQHCTQYHTRT